MIKMQRGFYTLFLATLCSTSYAVAPAATITPVATTPAATTTTPANTPAAATPVAVKATTDAPAAAASTTTAAPTATTATTATTASTTGSAPVTYADTPIDDAPVTETKDPYEGFNRAIFSFNETVDKYVMKPVATGYNAIMPKPLNSGIHNFFNNLGTLPTLANDLLQFNFYQAANDSWRLVVNSTIGVAGFFDVGSRIGLKYYENDFGLTLASWGYENSNYLVLPFVGPSTPRDGILGMPVDYFVFSVYPHIYPKSTRYQLFGLWVVDRRAYLLKYQDVLDEAAVDKYVFIRNAAMQRRAHQIDTNQHLSYNERETSQEPVADLTQEEAAASLEATAEPIEPVDQPLASGSPANAEAPTAAKSPAVTSATKTATQPAAKQEAKAG